MKRTDLLKRLNKALSPDKVDFSAIDSEVAKLKKSLQETVNIQTVDDVSRKLKQFQDKIDFGPLVKAIEEAQSTLQTNIAGLENRVLEKSTEVVRASEGESTARVAELQQELEALRTDLKEATNAKAGNLALLSKQTEAIRAIQSTVTSSLATLYSKADAKTETEKFNQDIQSIGGTVEALRKDLINRISQIGGGAQGTKFTINGALLSKKYRDINLKGIGLTYSAADNDATKMVDLTLSASAVAGFLENGVGISGGTILIGGTDVANTLTLRSTSGVGTTGADIIFQTGNNGATEAMRILNSGNVGIGTASPGTLLDIVTGQVLTVDTINGHDGVAMVINPITVASGSGKSLTLSGGNAVGSGNGGSLILNSGASASNSSPGSITIQVPDKSGGSGAQGDINIIGGLGGTSGTSARGSNINLTAGSYRGSNTATAGGIVLLSGNTSGATGTASGFITLTTATPASSTKSLGSGAISLTIGDAGAISFAGGTAANSGVLGLFGGAGGAATAATGGTAGNGSDITLTSGVGGSATGSSGTRNGGNSGNIILTVSAAGTGATANGAAGTIQLMGGNVGVGTAAPYSTFTVRGANGTPPTYTNGVVANIGLFLNGTIDSTNNFLTTGDIGAITGTTAVGNGGSQLRFLTQPQTNGAIPLARMTITKEGNVGIGTTAPTHSLTLNSTSTGTAIYNTVDQTTNYERIVTQWSSNQAQILYQGGGTGAARTLAIGAQNPGSGNYVGLKINRSATPFIASGAYNSSFAATGLTVTAGDVVRLWEDTGLVGPASGQVNIVAIKPTYNETTSTGILNTDLLINRTETSLGTTPGAQYFIDMQVAGASKLTFEHGGAIARYSSVATAGWGVPAIYGSGRSTAQTAAVASVATYTVGAADGSFLVSANANITAFTAGTFNVTVAYTDETNTSRTLTLNFSSLTGTLGIALAAAGPFEGVPAHIRCKAATTITVATSGTFTSLTYNVEGVITQIT